ncbi:predicted protein [Nematostella vectensis]|uniref:Mirror-image polydactyly gene 1 protein n=1 Tax=Nematostella vectensis TaxID=45351 RepID=A7RRP4_NEMVE|nr:predicted protein [Nematostella vectensis]|eukprot:XP_001637926.1 predicted protein [Nematostella vectensis]
MESIREDLDYFDREKSSASPRRRAMNGYDDDMDEVEEMKQNVRSVMQGARRKMANLRLDVEERDKLLESEKKLREQMERELANKTAELYKERAKALSRSPEETRYSSFDTSLDYNGNVLHRGDLEASLNHQLTEKLAEAESEILASRMSRDNLISQVEQKIAARGAALVEKIYQAQKERDAAMAARLRLAGDEKDDLMSRIRRIEKDQAGFDSGVDSVYDEDDDKSMRELFGRLATLESPRSIDKQGSRMAERLRASQKQTRQETADELKVVLEERDAAVAKTKILESEISKLQKELEMVKNQYKLSEKHRQKTNQAQLLSAQHERDALLRKTKRLEEELETIRVYYSLHRSLSQENSLRDQFNTTMDSFESRLRAREGELVVAQRSYDDLAAKLRSVSTERNTLANQVQDLSKNYHLEKERADKLERLVSVLRKRNNTGTISVETVN